MHIEFLVEEPSVQIALENLLPKILNDQITFNIHVYNGKPDLLRKLPARLKGYRSWIEADWRIVVMIDEDRQDCKALKQELEQAALLAGFTTKTSSPSNFQVLNRIVIEELEAWFFGDNEALMAAYPKISSTLNQQKGFRNPDAILGGTWEALERVLMEKGYHAGGLEKLRAAREISVHMLPERNQSLSFQIFYQALLEMIG